MKARAWLSMFLIIVISYTGFGLTTSDLTKNSTAVTIADYDVGCDVLTAIVVMDLDFTVNDANSYAYSHLDKIESKTLVIKELLNFEKPTKEMLLIPPLWQSNKIFNTKTTPKLNIENHLLTYRRARDGITQKS